MTIEYRDPIDGEEMANLSQAETDEMGSILYEVRKHNLAGKIVAGNRKHHTEEDASVACKSITKLDDVFLIRAFDGDKCVGFRFIKPAKYSSLATPRNSEEEAKYGHIRDWWLSQGLKIKVGGTGQCTIIKRMVLFLFLVTLIVLMNWVDMEKSITIN